MTLSHWESLMSRADLEMGLIQAREEALVDPDMTDTAREYLKESIEEGRLRYAALVGEAARVAMEGLG